jgi:hypothetical protein
MFKAEQLLIDNQIDYATEGDHKHARPGWVQIKCPFCSGNPGWHGGINIERGYYNCYRCGSHWLPKVIQTLLRISIPEAKALIRGYTVGGRVVRRRIERIKPETLDAPKTQPLTFQHKEYLRGRGFNPDKIERMWGISSTEYHGYYKYRIFIPILFEHKHLVYGFDYAVEKRRCVVVEGVTDVWRLGAGAVATFGKVWTQEQVTLICNNFDKVFVMLDSDVPKKDSKKLAHNISAHGCWSVDIIGLEEGDPGDLSPEEAKEVMGDLGF